MANEVETIFTVTLFSSSRKEPLIIENNSITTFTFIEDIYNSLSLAVLQFTDRAGVVESLPIIGKEFVSIMYGPDKGSSLNVDSSNKVKNFISYDVDFKSEINNTGSGVTTVTMKLVDPLYITMNYRRFSKSWLNKTGSEIIEDICTNMIGGGYKLDFVPDRFEKSTNMIGTLVDETNKSFIMPYWTPTETIRWLIKRMTGTKGPGYLFYSNTKGFNLVTLGTLIENNTDIDPEKYFFNATDKDMYFNENRILSGKMFPPGNQALSYLGGGTSMSPRFDTKDMRENNNIGSEEYNKYIFPTSENLYQSLSNVTSNVITLGGDYETINNTFRDGWIKRYMKQLQMEILVKGHVKRFAGMLIDLQWPAMKTNTQNTKYNGRYLIQSIEHIFTPSSQPAYKQLMKISKTGFEDISTGGALSE